MSSQRTWKLKFQDGTVQEFIDIRRKVGNQIVRAYLLDPVLKSQRITRTEISLRGPKDEWKDFAKFLILKVTEGENEFGILAETGVYENLRIVGTDSEEIAQKSPSDITQTFTEALKDPQRYSAVVILSTDSKVKSE
ncbi:MAG: hypothetical protein KAW94_02565 [Candidatus Thorarchaeota archaeon]|nr:hypothetical protein [Candidatus Thorarchaeota archaeon]